MMSARKSLSMRAGKLDLLEFGRGAAAFAVVLGHVYYFLVETPEYLQFARSWGAWAVRFFFILSGFIMVYVHGNDAGAAKAVRFAWRRIVRIFPTYWLVLATTLALRQYVGNQQYVESITPWFLISNFFLLPRHGPLFISVAWTLRHEMLFYFVFFITILNFRVGIFLAMGWLTIAVYSYFSIGPQAEASETSWGIVSHQANFYFLIGITIALLVKRFSLQWMLAYGPPLSRWLGQISYPLYLCHGTAFLVIRGVATHVHAFYSPTWHQIATAGILSSLVVATAISVFFEIPVLSSTRSSVT